MAEDRERFLGRWSRLKQAHRTAPEAAPDVPPVIPDSAVEAPSEATANAAAPDAGDAEAPPLELPSVESLDKDSDFTVFLREGVPEETKRLALRKLWRSDPVLANLDGLLEYGEDFGAPWRTNTVVKTLYQVGKGMQAPLEEAVEEIAAETPGPEMSEAPSDRPSEPVSDAEPAGSDETDAAATAADREPVASSGSEARGRDMKSTNS